MDNGACSYRRYLDGDDEGIVELIHDYKDGLIFFLYRYVHDYVLAEDLAEDVFVLLAVKKPRYNTRNTFKTWLFTIARNLAIDRHRVQRNRKAIIHVNTCDGVLATAENPESLYITNEQNKMLYQALARLKPDYSEVLHLAYFEAFSTEEIARILKKNGKQISNLLYRAKCALKDALEEGGFRYEEL